MKILLNLWGGCCKLAGDVYDRNIYGLDNGINAEEIAVNNILVRGKELRRRVVCLDVIRNVDEDKVIDVDDSLDSRLREAGL